jgi:hypothetical protein
MSEWVRSPVVGGEHPPLKKRMKQFSKSNRVEFRNCLMNFEAFFEHLQLGGRPHQSSLVRSEGEGLFALDQDGPGNPKLALRLDVYPDQQTKTLHLLQMGDKRTQQEDVNACHQSIRQLRASREIEQSP